MYIYVYICIYANMKAKMIAHISEVLYDEMWGVKEWVELFCNLLGLSVDAETFPDCKLLWRIKLGNDTHMMIVKTKDQKI